MRRLFGLSLLAFLMAAVASPATAGYLIIRIVMEGAEAGSDGGKGPGKGLPPGGGFQPGGLQPGGLTGSGKFKGGTMPGGATGGGGTDSPAHTPPSHCVVAVIPFEEDYNKQPRAFYPYQPAMTDSNPLRKDQLHATYRGEKLIANLFTDGNLIQWYHELIKTPSLTKTKVSEVKDMYKNWSANKSDVKLLLTTIESALAIGMVDDAMAYADELLATHNTAPDKSTPDVKAFAAAYGKMQAGISHAPEKPVRPQRKMGTTKMMTQGHYCVLYGETSTDAEATRRLGFLEENFKAFFLWHATRGIALPMPDSPLVVILTNGGTSPQPGGADVHSLIKALDGPPHLTADGFYSTEHDLLVLSPDRLDEVGLNFVRYTEPVYLDGFSREKMLSGVGPKLSVIGKIDSNSKKELKKPDEMARMQTIALVDKLVEDSAIMAAISREGSRQLLYATGQLPRYVDVPEWLGNGAGNFFARPKEPAFITNAQGKAVMHVAMATGYGAPNYVLHRYFKDLLEKGDLNPNRAALLRNVLTDAYFRAASNMREYRDPDPPKADKGIALGSPDGKGPPMGNGPGMPPGPGQVRPGMGPGMPGPGPGGAMTRPGMPGMNAGPGAGPGDEDHLLHLRKQRERVGIKAQATSWALYYYLAKARPNELRAYLAELAAMPRDLPLEGASVTAFYRAFGLDGRPESLKKFADDWLEYIHTAPPAGMDILIHDPKPSKDEGLKGPPGSTFPRP